MWTEEERQDDRERDAKRDFEKARSSYAGEFSNSEDPLAKAAGKVMDAVGDLFGQGGQGQPPKGAPRSIEDVIDEIFGPRH